MKVINVQEAKTHLSRLLDEVAKGEVYFLGKHGRPVAKLTAFNPPEELRRLGGLEGQITISADFDEDDARIAHLFTGAGE